MGQDGSMTDEFSLDVSISSGGSMGSNNVDESTWQEIYHYLGNERITMGILFVLLTLRLVGNGDPS